MAPNNHRIFLDTSVVFAAILSPDGGARLLFRLGEAGVIKLLVGPNVLRECEDVVRRKAPASLSTLAVLLNTARVETLAAPTSQEVAFARTIIEYEPDAHVLAEAIHANPDWFITHDKKHLLKNRDETGLRFRIGTPGELIQTLKDNFTLP
jgi:predicted nucleic acid-binding protein